MRIHFALPALGLLAPSAAAADPVPAKPVEFRLTPEQIEQVLADAERKPRAAPEALIEKEQARPIHGEVGVTVGSDGTRAAFGTAVVPLADDGIAILSVDAGRYRQPLWVSQRPEKR
ncbi:hypothetical protein [Sphingomonas xanthus]|uniref:Uncharacterized protein n=1 Tax=Sphingomonas xanthus TaxID=2594473 RepID=A0A516IT63_9SPHN|nr:hypothetical protein [Sphingomonas xanthus]QDP20087.1 hypothetical protein FMM02_09055 [Sphingomonas xanthus]